MSRLRVFAYLLMLALVAPSPVDAATVLLRDDFDGCVLDTDLWFVPEGPGTFFGRTQIRPPAAAPSLAGGVLRLRIDTHNPRALVPGDSFWGSEVATVATYAVETGLSFRARARLVPPVRAGMVASLFSFVFLPAIPGRDEIDVELLTNDVVAARERVLTNAFDDADFAQPGDKAFAGVAGLDLAQFHVFEVRWFTDRVEWRVDGALVRTETGTVPDDPQNVRLNFWVPDAFFAEAYDAALQPAATVGANEIFVYEVDWVEIRRLGVTPAPGLGSAGGIAAVLLVAGLLRRRAGGRARNAA